PREQNRWCVCWRRPGTRRRRPPSVLASRLSCDESSADRPDGGTERPAGLLLFPEDDREELRVCGIIGYVGSRPAKDLLLHGLERLEYRGYDSAGLALRENGRLEYVRAVGTLQFLTDVTGPNGSLSGPGLAPRRTRARSP